MGIVTGIAQLLTDLLELDSVVRDGIAVVWMVIVACWLLMDFFAESNDRKGRGEDPGEGGKRMDDGNRDPVSYEERQKLTPEKLIVLERDFMIPKEYLRGQRRIQASLVVVVVCLSLLAVLYISSRWWVIAASALYLVVVVGTVWSPKLRRKRENRRHHAAWRSRSEG